MTLLNLADALKVGSTTVDKVYAGTTLIWPTDSEPEPTAFTTLAASLNPSIWWRLGETSGTTAVDASGNGHHGTYITAAVTATGLLHDGDTDPATSFNADHRIELAHTASWGTGAATSLFLRAKPANLSGTKQLIARRQSSQTTSAGFTIRMDSANLVFYPFSNFSGNTISYGPLVANQEYSVGLSYNTTLGRYEAYLNGALVGTKVTAHRATDRILSVASSSATLTEPFRGVIDEVLYWNSTLSATDHAALHAAATGA